MFEQDVINRHDPAYGFQSLSGLTLCLNVPADDDRADARAVSIPFRADTVFERRGQIRLRRPCGFNPFQG